MTDAPDLKPCPFCGGKAVYDRRGSHRQSTIVECTECGARCESNDYLFPERMWNTRADLPDPEAAARIAALEEANARLRADLTEANRRLGGGCDAHPDKGDHTVIRQGRYSFCAACGESLKGIRYCHEPRPTMEAPE